MFQMFFFFFFGFALDTSYIISYLFFFYGGHTLISRTTPSWFKYLLIWKSSLFNDNVTTNYYFLWHPISIWGVKNIVKKMKKDFECFCKLNKQRSWFCQSIALTPQNTFEWKWRNVEGLINLVHIEFLAAYWVFYMYLYSLWLIVILIVCVRN